MLRRHAISILLGALGANKLDRFLGGSRGTALLVDIASKRVIAASGPIGTALAPPGSALKPFVLSALIRSGRLRVDEAFPCPGRLRIGNRSFDCIHPKLAAPVRVDTALAYSCNCFVANAAGRFAPGELARELERFGFSSRTGWMSEEAAGRIQPAGNPDAQKIQALGEDGILITVAEMAWAYRLLALRIDRPDMEPILEGLEGAVEFGTAQNARLSGTKLAGKTGSATAANGEAIAWFAGFLPSRAPKTVVVVMLPGRSGGADAAPIAKQILDAQLAELL